MAREKPARLDRTFTPEVILQQMHNVYIFVTFLAEIYGRNWNFWKSWGIYFLWMDPSHETWHNGAIHGTIQWSKYSIFFILKFGNVWMHVRLIFRWLFCYLPRPKNLRTRVKVCSTCQAKPKVVWFLKKFFVPGQGDCFIRAMQLALYNWHSGVWKLLL